MEQAAQTKKKYIKRYTGNVINPNLDDHSLRRLLESQQIHLRNGNSISQSVLIRRAVRFYAQYLKQLERWDMERVEIQRAEAGVL